MLRLPLDRLIVGLHLEGVGGTGVPQGTVLIGHQRLYGKLMQTTHGETQNELLSEIIITWNDLLTHGIGGVQSRLKHLEKYLYWRMRSNIYRSLIEVYSPSFAQKAKVGT